MGKVINYLQQPESLHALTALLLNTRAFGAFTVSDLIEWFDAQYGVVVKPNELKERWHELAELGFAEKHFGWKQRATKKIGYVLNEKGEKMSQALMDCIAYIGKLQGGDNDSQQRKSSVSNANPKEKTTKR